MFVKLMKYCRGYVRLSLTGFSPERFLNLCCNHNIFIWDVVSRGDYYELSMSLQGFFSLKSIVRKTGTKVVVLEKHGLPFFLQKYRKRKMFFAGCLMCIFTLYLLSLFIWDIGVEGNYGRTTEVILRLLKEEGVAPGMKKSRVDCEAIERLLRESYEDVTWASARVEGTRLMVRIKENDVLLFVPEKDDLTAGDLTATADGRIERIVTRSGTPQVKAGDEVKAGDVLVAGSIPVYNDAGEVASYQYTKADADISVRTTRAYEDCFSLRYEEKLYTGKERVSYGLQVFETLLTLPGLPVLYESFDVVEEVHTAKLFENFYLPLRWQKAVSKEYVIVGKSYTKEEAKALASQNFKKYCATLAEKGVQIIENNVKISIGAPEKNMVRTAGTLTVLEEAVKVTPIRQEIQPISETETKETD